MLSVKTTKMLAGVTISGTYSDLDLLYDALFNVIGTDRCYNGYYQSQLRVMGLCYEIRHAYQGDRQESENDYGEKIYSLNYYWPEIIFLYAVLEDFILYSRMSCCYLQQEGIEKQFLNKEIIEERKERLPDDAAYVEYFRSLIKNALGRTIDEKKFKRLITYFDYKFDYSGTLRKMIFVDYCTQWVDIQNVKYLKRAPEKRRSYLATIAEKIIYDNYDYKYLRHDLLEYEKELKTPYYEIELEGMQYPDKIEW